MSFWKEGGGKGEGDVPMAAGADFVEETAVYFVLFCAVNGGQI